MEAVRVGGRNYTDPDVISLIRATGSLVDPRSSVVSQARNLVAQLGSYDGVPADAIERLVILASMLRIQVTAMNLDEARNERRDAVLVPTESGRSAIAYNPRRPRGRVAFSIAHEISHAFFPNSTRGARFRSICRTESKEANELERLCDLGASELLMPIEEFQKAAAATGYSLSAVDSLSARFGSSFEAAAYRLASAHPGIAISGLLRYRLKVGEQRQLYPTQQTQLFSESKYDSRACFHAKYRRQSFYMSEACDSDEIIRWNKSFGMSSVVYQAGSAAGIVTGNEALPNRAHKIGRLEAIRAPYQCESADPDFPDVLFFWSTET